MRGAVRTAAPSWCVPGGLAENCRFIAEHHWPAPGVDEVGLCLFETEACLAYTEADLPPQLAELELSYHAHLPLDLDWSRGAEPVWGVVQRLVALTTPLRPRLFVLHPPVGPFANDALRNFLRLWAAEGLDPAHLCVENVAGQDLLDLLPPLESHDARVCLDLGHVSAYGQDALLPALEARPGLTAMVHAYASPGSSDVGHSHAPLTDLDANGRDALARALGLLNADGTVSDGGTVLVEVFDRAGVEASLPVLAQTWNWEGPCCG